MKMPTGKERGYVFGAKTGNTDTEKISSGRVHTVTYGSWWLC